MGRSLRNGIGALVLVLAACSGSGVEGGDEAYQAPPEEWRIVEEARIGSADDPEDALSQVGTLLPLPDGGAWFIETQDRQVRVVGSDGRLSGRVGRPGQGPGEFTLPAGLGWWKGSTDTIWVGDRASRRISLFSRDGTFLESHPMPTVEWEGEWVVAHPGVVGPEGVGIGLAGYRPGSGAWERFPVVAFELPGGEVRGEVLSVPRVASVQIQFRGEVVATGVHPMPDAPLVAYAPNGKLVVVAERDTEPGDASSPEVRLAAVAVTGDTLWERRLPYEPQAIPAPELDAIWNERIEGFRRFATLENRMTPDEAEEAYVTAMTRPPHRPPVASVRVDADHRVLVVWSAAPGSAAEAWLLDGEGDLLAGFTVPEGRRVIGLDGETVWLLELDELDVPFLVRSRLEAP